MRWSRKPNGHRRNPLTPKLEQLESREVPALSFLQGQVYHDANANGVRDAGESAIPGTQVELRDDVGGLIATTAVVGGTYRFDNLQSGTYRLVQVLPTGYANQAANIDRWDLGGATVLAANTIEVAVSDVPVHLDVEARGNNTSLRMTLTNPLPTAITGISSSGRFFDSVGELQIALSGGSYAPTSPLLTTYCLDLTNKLPAIDSAGATVTPATTPPAPTFTANAGRIAYLYNTYGRNGFTSNPAANGLFTSAGLVTGTPAEDAAAFQLALWELCYDTGVGDLASGNFFFRAVNGQPDFSTDAVSVEIRAKANAFLQDSIGKSDLAVFLAGASAPAGQGTQTTIISGSLDFGLVPASTISGAKYNDLDGDGVRDDGESGIAGWTIQLQQLVANNWVDVSNATTGSDGGYTFGSLPVGTFRVREVGQTGWVQTSQNPADITTTAGSSSTGKNFGNFQLGSIGGVKYNDLDGDGVREDGEGGLSGWTIELEQLVNGDWVDVITTTTGANGAYSFGGLAAGTYRVREVGQSGWVQMSVNPGDVAVTSGTVSGANDFGNFQLASVGGLKFEDLNGDGVKQASESGLAGFTFRLERFDGTNWVLVTTATSGADGTFTFSNVGVGTYRVREMAQTGWVQSTANPAQFGVTQSGASVNGQVFGNYRPGSISGTKFLDQNGDGVWTPQGQSHCSSSDDERVLAGWTIFVDYNGNEVLDAGEPFAVTGSDGKYTITGVKPGTWNVEEVMQLTWLRTTSDRTVTVTSGSTTTNVLFGNFRGDKVECGDTATIGFWQNKNGQSLIRCLNGSSTSVLLGNWLATEFPNLFGSLAGKTNSQVASYFTTLFQVQGMKLEAQIMATALAVYVTDRQLAGGTYARRYGFNVDNVGTAGSLYNVGSNGAAFGVANYSTLNVWNILKITDANSTNGVAWVTSTTFRTMGNNVFNGINQQGDI